MKVWITSLDFAWWAGKFTRRRHSFQFSPQKILSPPSNGTSQPAIIRFTVAYAVCQSLIQGRSVALCNDGMLERNGAWFTINIGRIGKSLEIAKTANFKVVMTHETEVVIVFSSLLWRLSVWNIFSDMRIDFKHGELIGWLWVAIGGSHVSDRLSRPHQANYQIMVT